MAKAAAVMPMRLLVVTQYFWPETFRINELVAELVRRGHSVTVLTGKPNYPSGQVFPDFVANPSQFLCFEGAEVVRVPILSRGSGRGWRLAANYIVFALSGLGIGVWKLRRHKFDAIFIYQPSPITVVIPAMVLGRIKRAPLTLWVLDLWPETLRAMGLIRPGKIYDLLEIATRWIFLSCDLVLGQSHRITETIREKTEGAVKVEYFPAWSDQVFEAVAHVARAPEVPCIENDFTILFSGNIGEAQDFPAILDAALRLRDFKNIRWVVVGDGRMSRWVREQVELHNLGARFLLVGRHPLERMPEFFAHADALLLSLKSDDVFSMTIPGKLQAYLASGIPILAMTDGEAADIVDKSGAGLSCSAGDVSGLVQIIHEMVRMDPLARKEMGLRGRIFCQEHYEFSKLVSKLEASLADPKVTDF